MQILLYYGIRTIFFIFVAWAGAYVGYRINHKRTVYINKQRRAIKNQGKLMAYLNRHYKAIYGMKKILQKGKNRNKEWLYRSCYGYASTFELWEINSVKAYLKKDAQSKEIMPMIITVVGFGITVIADTYAEMFLLWCGMPKTEVLMKSIKSVIILLIVVGLLIWIITTSYSIAKQAYLISILEDVERTKTIGMN